MKTAIQLIIVASMLSFTACNIKTNEQEVQHDTLNVFHSMDTDTEYPKTINGLTISPVLSTLFNDASIEMKSPADGKVKAGKVNFEFDVQNYVLGIQTEDAPTKGMANSDKGQHIHFIMDNEPYAAHYESKFAEELPEGHHVILAFLSRSYHESVKGNYVLQELNAGSSNDDFDETGPHMFYSRPKGEYVGKDADKIMLDWYLVNCDLSPDGFKVRAIINGNVFWFDKWVPYAIEGLPEGENTIKLELFNAEQKSVVSPFNPVSRTITVKR